MLRTVLSTIVTAYVANAAGRVGSSSSKMARSYSKFKNKTGRTNVRNTGRTHVKYSQIARRNTVRTQGKTFRTQGKIQSDTIQNKQSRTSNS